MEMLLLHNIIILWVYLCLFDLHYLLGPVLFIHRFILCRLVLVITINRVIDLHKMLCRDDFEVSCSELDELVEAAMEVREDSFKRFRDYSRPI